MIVTSSIFLAVGIISLVSYFVIFFKLKKRKIFKVEDTFLNSFGYEFYRILNPQTRIILYALLIISSFSFSLSSFFSLSYIISNYLIIVASIFTLGVSLITISNFIPLSQYKIHLVSFFVGLTSLFSSTLLIAIANLIGEILPGFICIIALFFAAIIFSFLINPYNSNWFKLEKNNSSKDNKFVKPKINFLALEEWLSLSLILLISILYFSLNLYNYLSLVNIN